jgi:Flp pilus assembly CpaE family ATPase
MARISHTILLIESSPDHANLVQSWVAAGSRDTAIVLISAETLAAGLRQVAKGGVDLILLDLNLPDSSGLRTFEAVKTTAGGVPIIVLSAGEAEALTLQAIHRGAEDYLVKSKCGPELFVRVVESAIVRHKARESGKPAKVIGIISAAGGTGSTTIACTFAAELRRQTNEKVLLADLNLSAGLVAFMFGMTNTMTFSMRDAVDNFDRLDQSCWENMVLRGPADLHIVASPDLLGADDLPSADISRVLNLIKPFYQWIVLDLGRLNGCSMGLLKSVDDVLVVTTPAVPSIYGAILAVNALKGVGFEGTRLGLIVNQIGKSQPLRSNEIDKLFGIQINARLPAAPYEMEEACRLKRLPGENSAFRKQVAVLARKIAGLPEPLARRNFGWLQWLSRGFRRTRDSESSIRPVSILRLDP